MKSRGVIFDFDGVLVDSFEILYQMVRESFAEIGEPLTREQYRNFYLKNVKQAEKEVLGEERFNMFQECLAKKRETYSKVQLFDFAKEFVPAAAAKGSLAIVSSTSAALIEQKLQEQDLDKNFTLILGANRELSKQEKLNQVLLETGDPKADSFFITDTVGDIHDGKTFGLKTVGVTWGFHDLETLQQAQPDFIVNTPEELLACLKSG